MLRQFFPWFLLFLLSLVLSIGISQMIKANNVANISYDRSISSNSSSDSISFPANYKNNFFHYATIECPNSAIVRQMYANSTAIEAARSDRTLPNGSVIVMETHGARRNENSLEPVNLNNIFVRSKTSESNNGNNWQSRWFSPSENLVSNNQNSCRSCHNRVRDRDYVFTLPQLVNGAKTNTLQRSETEFGLFVCR